jgi:hypothetical protein
MSKLINAEMVKAARAKKYRQDEGFVDEATTLAAELSVDTSEALDQAACDLARAAGVSVAIAETVIVEWCLGKFIGEQRRLQNN